MLFALQILIHSDDPAMAELLQSLKGDPDLRFPPELSNAIDDLRFVLIVSQVRVRCPLEAIYVWRLLI